jgi:hypothetical protein
VNGEPLVALWLLVWIALFILCIIVVRAAIWLFRRVWAYLYAKANPPVRFRTSITIDRSTKQVAKSIEQVG